MMAAVPVSAAANAAAPDATPALGQAAAPPVDPGAPSARDSLPRFADLWRHTASAQDAPQPDSGDAMQSAPPDDTPQTPEHAARPEATPAFAPWPGLVTAIATPAIDVAAPVVGAPAASVTASSVTALTAPREARGPAPASADAPAKAAADIGAPARDLTASTPRQEAPAAADTQPDSANPAPAPAPGSSLTPRTAPVAARVQASALTTAGAAPDLADDASASISSRTVAPWSASVAPSAPAAIDVAAAVMRAPALPPTSAPATATADVAAPVRDVPAAPGADPEPAVAASAPSRAPAPAPAPAPVRERVAAPDGTMAAPDWAAAATPVSAHHDAPAVTVKLAPTAPEQWRQPLAEALGERLRVQLGRGSEAAVIRLDPPMLGRIEISIRHEAGSLQVQLSASNGEVLRQLHGIGDSLRQDLSQRQPGQVSVVVSDSSRDAGAGAGAGAGGGGDQRGRGRDARDAEDGPGRALAEAETDDVARARFGLAREGREAA